MPLGYEDILTFFICSSLITKGLCDAENGVGEVRPSSSYSDIPSFSQLHWLP